MIRTNDNLYVVDVWIPSLIGLATLLVTWKQLKLMEAQMGIESGGLGRLRVYWPVAACILLGASAWVPYWFRPDDLPEWPTPKAYYVSYSVEEGSCTVVANGDNLLRYSHNYRLAAACYLYNGIGDQLDAPMLQINAAYEITRGSITMRIPWSPSFSNLAHAVGTNNPRVQFNQVMLLLPSGVDTAQFATLRQARAMGVKIVGVGSNISQVHN